MSALSEYQTFTKPAELHKAINTLRGLVAGLKADSNVSSKEINELVHWCELHAPLRNRHPFSEILPVVERACEDGVIDESESKDILWLCSNFVDNNSYYNWITSSLQFLSGLIHGIMADGELSDNEIFTLKKWLDSNSFLEGSYPFDEINSLLYSVLEDKTITLREKEELVAFFSNFVDFSSSLNLIESEYVDYRKKYTVSGICAMCPEISFETKTFCFTGESYCSTRKEMTEAVQKLGGIVRSNVSSKTDYLIVGNAGNPCWVHACYGRKIEEAMAIRKNNGKVIIVNETDFWDSVEDTLAGIES